MLSQFLTTGPINDLLAREELFTYNASHLTTCNHNHMDVATPQCTEVDGPPHAETALVALLQLQQKGVLNQYTLNMLQAYAASAQTAASSHTCSTSSSLSASPATSVFPQPHNAPHNADLYHHQALLYNQLAGGFMPERPKGKSRRGKRGSRGRKKQASADSGPVVTKPSPPVWANGSEWNPRVGAASHSAAAGGTGVFIPGGARAVLDTSHSGDEWEDDDADDDMLDPRMLLGNLPEVWEY